MKTAQETKDDVITVTDEHAQAIKNLLEGLGYKKIGIFYQLNTHIDENPAKRVHLNIHVEL